MTIRAYRAIDDIESCKKYAEGHEQVLRSYGIPKVTSSNDQWFYNPDVYVISVEHDGKVYGGARIHGSAGTQKLPFMEAVGHLDHKVNNLTSGSDQAIGELCGLWNSKEIAGKGYSVLLTKACVAKVGVTIANLLELSKLYVFCAPYTVKMVQDVGFEIVDSVGDEGKFLYPKDDMIATLLAIKDVDDLGKALPEKREGIFDLRRNPRQVVIEKGPKGDMEVEYDLYISSLLN